MEEEQVHMTEPEIAEDALNGQAAEGTSSVQEGEEGLGKFKNSRDLLRSYENLQREYTKKCQILSEYKKRESGSSTELKNEQPASLPAPSEELFTDPGLLEKYVYNNEAVKNKIITDYLISIAGNKAAPELMSGSGTMLVTPPAKPASVREAGRMMQEMISKRRI